MLEIPFDTLLKKKKIPGQKGGRDPLGPLLNPPLIFIVSVDLFRGMTALISLPRFNLRMPISATFSEKLELHTN